MTEDDVFRPPTLEEESEAQNLREMLESPEPDRAGGGVRSVRSVRSVRGAKGAKAPADPEALAVAGLLRLLRESDATNELNELAARRLRQDLIREARQRYGGIGHWLRLGLAAAAVVALGIAGTLLLQRRNAPDDLVASREAEARIAVASLAAGSSLTSLSQRETTSLYALLVETRRDEILWSLAKTRLESQKATSRGPSAPAASPTRTPGGSSS